MRLERDCHRFGALLAGPSHDLAQHVCVSPVHAIKITDADQRGSVVRGNVLEFVEDLHLKDAFDRKGRKENPRSSRRKFAEQFFAFFAPALRPLRLKLLSFSKSQIPASSRRTRAARAPAVTHSSPRAADRDKYG